jgi:sensor histidine kinase YesM
MDENPSAESVLGRLGESVNIIFNQSRLQKIVHPFLQEWKLVENIIHIHQLMYLKELEVHLPEKEEMLDFLDGELPLGLLQIPVENALLHGLSNREKGPWKLEIKFIKEASFLQIIIRDNGVGRTKAATLSNFTKHGTGLNNLNALLGIVNQGKPQAITIVYKDDIFNDEAVSYGTEVIITLPRPFNYELS